MKVMMILVSLEIYHLLKASLWKRMLLRVEVYALNVCKFFFAYSRCVLLCDVIVNSYFFLREKYKNPRVLSCLHVLCENCLKDLLAVDNEDENVIYSGRSKPHKAFIVCPLCKQETAV
jgi:hypothetical protein